MALKGRLRNKRSKRFANVPDHFSTTPEKMNFTSSDSETDGPLGGQKVGEGFSIKQLMKNSENYKLDGDHIYGKSMIGDENKTRNVRQRMKRKISEESDDKPVKQRCFSKNAVMARLNRERKKMYVSSLESENEDLRKQNDEIKNKILAQDRAISHMKREILYLKSLLVNSKELSQILQNFKAATGLPVTSSMVSTDVKSNLLNDMTDRNLNVSDEGFHQPRVRSVNSGSNFPIIDKDVNLGISLHRSSSSEFTDLESEFPNFENGLYDEFEPMLNNDITNDVFNYVSNSELDLEKSFKLDDLNYSDAGICLHLNTRGLSVEFCSICNSKAKQSVAQMENSLLNIL